MTARRPLHLVLLLVALAGLTAGCGQRAESEALARRSPPSTATTDPTATAAPPTSAADPPPPVEPSPPAAPAAPATTTTSAPRPRTVHEQAWTPFAVVEGVVLHHPSARVELVGFHESNHDGARELQPLPSAVAPVTLESRERGTGARTAADIVSDPAAEVRAPVTGRVVRAGRYVLYCRHSDDFAVIEPAARPGWEVKILHIDGVMVRPGDQVVAGETVVAPRPTQLPFESQVDEVTAEPAWPHVHVEVVDPSIPDRPSGGGC